MPNLKSYNSSKLNKGTYNSPNTMLYQKRDQLDLQLFAAVFERHTVTRRQVSPAPLVDQKAGQTSRTLLARFQTWVDRRSVAGCAGTAGG